MASKRRKALAVRAHSYELCCVICGHAPASTRTAIDGAPTLCVRCYRDQLVGSVVVDLGTKAALWIAKGKAGPEF